MTTPAIALPEPPLRGKRLIIVGGSPRSGTSMFQSMMDSHPDVYGGPEFDHLNDLVTLRNKLIGGIRQGRIDLFVDERQVDDSMGQLIESLLHPVADRHGKSYVSEKTPMNVLVFNDLMQMLPGAKFIHVVRDPRAVFVSMFNVARRLDQSGAPRPDFLQTSEKMVQYIHQCVSAGAEACESNLQHAITVRYEDLLTNTARIMSKTLEFLGIAASDAVLKPAGKPHDSERLLKDGSDPWAGGRSRFSDPEPVKLDEWRSELDAASIQVLNNCFSANPIYHALGYTFDN